MENSQTLAFSWPVFGLTLAGLFLFGIAYASLVRWMARHGIAGQTAYVVAVGVGITVLFAAALIGFWHTVLLLSCFAASGTPMIIEYVSRSAGQQYEDAEHAKKIARELMK